MGQEFVTQKEFIEKYEKGERNFSNMLMQFLDIADMKFSGAAFRNCKMLFCTFRNCGFRNATFENCEIYCGSFYTGEISSTSFTACKMEFTLFDSIQFSNAKMDKCSIRLCAIFNSNHASVDFFTSMQSRLLTNVSQITRADIEDSISETMAVIGRLDASTRMKLKEMLRQDIERYGLEKMAGKEPAGYGAGNERAKITYGEVKHLIESTFGAYAQKPAYEMKSPYEKQGEYRSKKRPDEIGF